MSGHGHIVRIRDQKRWTPQEKVRAKELRATGMYFRNIAEMMGKSENALRSFFKRQNPEYKEQEKMRSRQRNKNIRHKLDNGVRNEEQIKYGRAPKEAFAERDARYGERRTLTQVFFGDPEPSRSALFQKPEIQKISVRAIRITLPSLSNMEPSNATP